MCQLRDKESNLDLHVQGVASCRLDDPGTNGPRRRERPRQSMTDGGAPGRSRASPSIPTRWEIDAAGEVHLSGHGSSSSVSSVRSRTMFSMPLAYPSTLDHRLLVARNSAVDVLRGGALEPEPLALSR